MTEHGQATRRTILALLMVTETRLRDAMISLSEALLRMTNRPEEFEVVGAPAC